MTSASAARGDRFLSLRQAVVADERLSASQRRVALSELVDGWLGRLFAAVPDRESAGFAVVAVGGYGRRELLPGSDLDVLLVHGDAGDPAAAADRIFYPVWDAGIALDHAVRTVEEARKVAADDLKAALSLIDARHVAGDPTATERLRAAVLSDWRRQAAVRLPRLAAMVRARAEQSGELAHLLEPDLVQAYGGLRDTLVLRAVAASWVADRPHLKAVEEAREWLLVVRDALHRTTGRRHDRLLFEDHGVIADRLGLLDPDLLLRRVAEAGRAVAYASDVTWRDVERTLRARQRVGRHAPERRPLADGVVEHDGDAVLARDARPERDPVLPLRAAAAAAQAGLALAPYTLERLAAECPALPEPWPGSARDALLTLLGAGRSALPVWDALDFAGLVTRWIPEWERVRYRATRTPVHRHTVDRHLIETAVVASGLTRRVSRPDLLLLSALCHDLGKGVPGDHSETGEVIAADIGRRIGLSPQDTATLGMLVRHHLLLPEMATRRDPDDPATIAAVVGAVGDVDKLELLAALTEADATAAGSLAWSPMRATLVGDLVARVRTVLGGAPPPKPERLEPWQEMLAHEPDTVVRIDAPTADRACRVTVAVADRPDVLATVAGVLTLHRLGVRTATVETVGRRSVLVWRVVAAYGTPPPESVLRDDIVRALDGRTDIPARLAARAAQRRGRVIRHAEPSVTVIPEVSAEATVLEVRAHDEPGLLYRLAAAIGGTGVVIRSAVVETLGAEAVDVFYLVDPDGGPLSREAVTTVMAAASAALVR
ncbi:MAG TPA: [protein-PII] uridylyltransferase [Jiangellales bacterium]|nr:[protein-PII] uridylyltransferase [Jiangellales bacterium]